MKIYIARFGKRYGPYPLDLVSLHLKKGSVFPDDHAWVQGMSEEWEPLREVLSRIPGMELEDEIPDNLLTEAIARDFLNDPDSVNLSDFEEIEELAAWRLSRYEGPLSLDGLTDLGDPAAEYLSNHQGEYLSLDGLTCLSDESAESFSKHDGELYLNGVEELSKAAQQHLARHEGEMLLGSFSFDDDEEYDESGMRRVVEIRECEKYTIWLARPSISVEVDLFRRLEEDPFTGDDESDFIYWILSRFMHGWCDNDLSVNKTLAEKSGYESDPEARIREILEELFGEDKSDLEEFAHSAEKYQDNWWEIGESDESYGKTGGFNPNHSTGD